MKRLNLTLVSALAIAGLVGCQQADQKGLGEKLDQIDQRLANIETQIKSGGGRGAGAAKAKRPQRPRPNPKDVYAVPIAGSPYVGKEHAKITIVEAFEFA